jgi:drug/metabolite transporter (DMT)-like permease
MRLLPAGAALVAWAAGSGRPQPRTAAAWAWVAAFALVDGAAFQVRGRQECGCRWVGGLVGGWVVGEVYLGSAVYVYDVSLMGA